jgi:hypothetical protein
MTARDRYRRDFDDAGRWFVEDTETGRRIDVGDRASGAFVLAELFAADDHSAAFDRILADLGGAA